MSRTLRDKHRYKDNFPFIVKSTTNTISSSLRQNYNKQNYSPFYKYKKSEISAVRRKVHETRHTQDAEERAKDPYITTQLPI